MGIIALFYFVIYSVFAYLVISLFYILFAWIAHLKAKPLFVACILTLQHYFGYLLYLLLKGDEMNYDDTNLTGHFLLFSWLGGGIPVLAAYYLVSKLINRKLRP